MTLRKRLFLMLGGLVALLVMVQWWWTRSLAQGLSAEIDQVASSVSRSVAAFFVDHEDGLLAARRHLESLTPCAEDDGLQSADETSGAPGNKKRCAQEVRLVLHPRNDGEEAAVEEGMEDESLRRIVQQVQPRVEGETRVIVHDHGSSHPDIAIPEALALVSGGRSAETRSSQAYVYRFESRDDSPAEDEESAGDSTEIQVSMHIESDHEGRFLWLAGAPGDGPSQIHRFEIPLHGFQAQLDRFSNRLLFASLGILVAGLVLAGALAHNVSAPLRQLSDAALQVGDGALGTRVAPAASGEVGQAIVAFNRMSGRLEELDRRARELSARQHLGEIGEIARGLAHTLRNPLNALGLSVEELAARQAEVGREDEGTKDEVGQLADSARRQIQRIDHAIRSFLALASEGTGAAGEVDLTDLVEDVALEALQDARGRVRLEVDAARLPALQAVEPELRAVFQALVVNAIEASPDHGTVTVRLRSAGDSRARLEVEDHGGGLPPEIRSRLFTPHLTTKASGSGMGLFLAHRIASGRYRGHLELLDQDGGTRAVLEIGPRVDPAGEPA